MLMAAAFTMYYGKGFGSAEGAAAPGGQAGQQMQQGGTPPEMPSGQAQGGQSGDNAQSGQQSGTPPAKPEGESDFGQQGGTPPDLPSGEMQGGQDGQGSQQGGTPPDMPSGEMQGGQGGQGGAQQGVTPPDMQSGEMQGGQTGGDMQGEQPNSCGVGIVDTYRFAIYGVYGLVIGVFAAYLIMSRCNKRKFKESFKGSKRKVGYIAICFGITIFASGALLTISDSMDWFLTPAKSQQSNSSTEYKAVTTYDTNTNVDGQNYESNESDTLAVLVMNKISAVLNNFKLNKTGSSNGGDNTSFYGTNSGITAKDGASLVISDADIFTDASGANGVFSFGGVVGNGFSQNEGDGTNVTLKNSKITTKQDNSGGVMVTGGGIMRVINAIIETFGTSSASLRTDRGGGNLDVEGGTYTTNGNGSPSIYCTADINVKDAELTSNASEGVVIEGMNSVNLENCKLTDNNCKLNGQSTTYKNIFLYQSMSGDSAEGTSHFSAKDCSLITKNGDAFYATNTSAVFDLENNEITNEDSNGNLLRVQKDS